MVAKSETEEVLSSASSNISLSTVISPRSEPSCELAPIVASFQAQATHAAGPSEIDADFLYQKPPGTHSPGSVSTDDGMDLAFALNEPPKSIGPGELCMSAIDARYNELLNGARRLSYTAFLLSLVQGTVAFCFGIRREMISLTAMGAQICIDLVSSVFVVWRFYSNCGARSPRHADAQTRAREAVRERRGALGVGVLLICTAIWAGAWSFVRVFRVPPPAAERLVRALTALSISWPGFLVFSAIAIAKWSYAMRLNSRVLSKDAVCTTFGCVLSLVTAVFATIDYSLTAPTKVANTGAADAVAALIISALLAVEGFRTVWHNSIGWIPPSGVTRETLNAYYQARHESNASIKHGKIVKHGVAV